MLFYRSFEPILISFRLRPGAIVRPFHTLQLRLTVRGGSESAYSILPQRLLLANKELPRNASGFPYFAVDPDLWDKKKQLRTDRSEAAWHFNSFIWKLKTLLIDIYIRQSEQNSYAVTPQTIWEEFKTGNPYHSLKPTVEPQKAGWKVIDALSELVLHVKNLSGNKALSPDTIEYYERTLRYMAEYLKDCPDFLAENFTVVTAVAFHKWLQKTRRMSPGQASKHLHYVNKAFDLLVEIGALTQNKLAGKKWPRNKTKPIEFLSIQQTKRLLESGKDFTGFSYYYWWWFSLMALTGMDYPDAKRYAANRKEFDRVVDGVRYIYINRNKPPHELCVIPVDGHPMLDKLDYLLANIPEKQPGKSNFNVFLKKLAKKLGVTSQINIKTARKTFGNVLIEQYQIKTVSRMMGHKSMATTLKHYTKTTEEHVLREVQSRVSQQAC